MGKTITWLHLSDLHAGKPGIGWDASTVMEALVKDLKKMEYEQGLHPDLVFFTGDAAFGQIGSGSNQTLVSQFAIAQQFFSSVREAFSPTIPSTDLFLVPGNHDLNRQVVMDDQTSWLDNQQDHWEIDNLLENGNPQWRRYMERLGDYGEFLKSLDNPSLLRDLGRMVYAEIRHKADISIGIGGFNTVWSCCRSGEKSKLWMGSHWQLNHVRSSLKEAAISIALMHHPSNWLTEHEDPDFERGLERDFKFILHGHEHTEWVSTGSDGYTRIAAGACYERSDKKNGYNFVRIDLEKGEGEVWLREYDDSGAGWVPCVVHGKTNDHGLWLLNHLSWLRSTPTSTHAHQLTVSDQLAQSALRSPVAPAVERARRFVGSPGIVIPQDLAGALAGWNSTLESGSLLVIMDQAPIEPVRDDIAWQIVQAQTDGQTPVNLKTPLLQELRTEEQIDQHFIPLPKYVDRLGEWLKADRDLLFLGLPFCGKTTLLTYLALEASRRQRDQIIPVYLRPREDLKAEDIDAAVVKLKDSLKQSQVLNQRQRVVLILDNAHTPVGFKIAQRLMESPRSWRIWAAARTREFADMLTADHPNPWSEEDCIRNACDLVGAAEIEFVMDQVIAPTLERRGDEGLIPEVRGAMKEAGQVPARFLIQVWRLVFENRGDVKTGYVPMIKAEPTGVEEIIRHVWPQNRPGVDALTIADYLKKSSWELLAYVLAEVEQYGSEMAAVTVSKLRKTWALLPDSEQPCRVTMYDPIRDQVQGPGNLTNSLKQQVWCSIEAFLEQGDAISEEGQPDDLADAWISLSDLAMVEERYTIALGCARRANEYATGNHQVETLRQIAYCLYEPEPNCDEVITCYREILDLLTEPGQTIERGNALTQLANCMSCNHHTSTLAWDESVSLYRQALELFTGPEQASNRARTLDRLASCLHRKPDPEWDEVIALYRQAYELRTEPEQASDRADNLYWIAYCLHSKPEPEWGEAISLYRQGLELRIGPEKAAERAETLYQIAYCLHSKPEPEWNEAISVSRQALALRTGLKQVTERVDSLCQIAYCLHSKPEPEWDEAIFMYRQALELCAGPEQASERTNTLHWIAYCMRNKPEPEWDEAISTYRQTLELLDGPEQDSARANTLFWIASCLHSKPEPEWDEAISTYRQTLELLDGPKQASARANTLFWIASCLHSKPEPEWDEAISTYRQSLGLFTRLEQAYDRAEALYWIASCLHSKPEPEWDEAISTYRQALDIYTALEQVPDRSATLAQIAYCLHHKPDPELDEAISLYRQAIDSFTTPELTINRVAVLHPWCTIGLIIALDCKGLFEEADVLAGYLENSSLVEGEVTDSDQPLITRRKAYLALRINDLDTVLELTEGLQGTSEHAQARLLASIAYFYRGRMDEAREAIIAGQSEAAWVRAIAIGYFSRYDPGKKDEYLNLLKSCD